MTIQEIIQQVQTLTVPEQVHLVSQLIQMLERTMQATASATELKTALPVTDPHAVASSSPSTAAVGIIAELIKNPIPFNEPPLTRQEICAH